MKKITLEKIQEKIVTYQIIVMMSFIFGVLGFVYSFIFIKGSVAGNEEEPPTLENLDIIKDTLFE